MIMIFPSKSISYAGKRVEWMRNVRTEEEGGGEEERESTRTL
jgi:hypothetical protein